MKLICIPNNARYIYSYEIISFDVDEYRYTFTVKSEDCGLNGVIDTVYAFYPILKSDIIIATLWTFFSKESIRINAFLKDALNGTSEDVNAFRY